MLLFNEFLKIHEIFSTSAHLSSLRYIIRTDRLLSYRGLPLKGKIEIMNGKSLPQSMQQFGIYPSKMIQLLKVGEETGQLDYFFAKVSEQYIEEVEYTTTALSSMMEPLIIIFWGLIVGVISMYLPLFR
jgi:type IV pilus assembly protein PilC